MLPFFNVHAFGRPNVESTWGQRCSACCTALQWFTEQENKGKFGRHSSMQYLEKGTEFSQDDSLLAWWLQSAGETIGTFKSTQIDADYVGAGPEACGRADRSDRSVTTT